MKAVVELPEEYEETLKIDLQKNKKLMLLINGLAIAIALVMAAAWFAVYAAREIPLFDNSIVISIPQLVVALVGMVVYVILHELVHGFFFARYGQSKPRYGFTGLYAFAASDDYFGKAQYLIIGLAPVIIWGVVLLVMQLLVPSQWSWVVYFIQIMNISGAAGDFYVTVKLLKMRDAILIRDWGTSMSIYAPKK